jgi:hypothetical protein
MARENGDAPRAARWHSENNEGENNQSGSIWRRKWRGLLKNRRNVGGR